MNKQTYKPAYFWVLLFLLALLLFIRLAATPIYILDEAKNAQCAREMLLNNNFIVPTFNGELRTDKPPLHYFFMIAAYKLFGVNEFAARFFSALMGLLTVLVSYFYIKKYSDAFTAFCSAAALVMCTQFLFEFRLAVPDPYLIFFITLGLFSGFSWLQKNNSIQLYICAASLALAALAKGPVALALPGLCLFIWIILKKKWKVFFTWNLIPAFLLFCIIALPWYVAVDKATNGQWTKGFFIDNNLNRFSDPQEGHSGFFILPFLFVLIGLLPFTVFSFEVLKKRHILFKSELTQFSGIVVAAFIIFFSVSSTKLPNYPMPCYPFAAIGLGNFIAALLNKEIISKKYPYYVLLVVILIIPIAGYFVINKEVEVQQLSWIALLLLIAPGTLLVLFIVGNKTHGNNMTAICVAYSLFNTIGLQYIYPKLYSENPVAKTIDLVKNSSYVYAYQIYNPGYNFYLTKIIQKFNSVDSLKQALSNHPDAIVISRMDFLDSLNMLDLKIIASHHDLFELPTTIILKQNAKP